MPILNIVLSEVGLVGVEPSFAYISTNDTVAEVTTAGYLNKAVAQGYAFTETMMALVSTKTSPSAASTQVGILELSKSGSNWSLVPTGGPGNVTLPTIASHIATYTNTTGSLSEDAATAINGGNIQAGLSATAGYFASFPSAALKGSLRLTAVANTGDTLVTISNALHGQASVYSIPDGGQATAEFIISDSAGTQHITSGALQVDAGAISSGLAAGGFVGLMKAYPTTAAKGFIALQAAVNATGDFGTTISNSTAQGQAQVISIPDAGAATSNFILSAASATQTLSTGLSFVGGGTNIQITGGGNFLAGASGAAGAFYAYPATAASGRLALVPVTNATGNFDTTISNGAAIAQSQVLTIPDVGAATGFINGQTVTANLTPAGVIITKDITLGFAALAAAGQVTIQAALATAQFKVRDIKVNYGAAGLSGGGGDRLVTVTDGTTVYNNAGITAALLGTPVNTVWGGTGNPLPGTVSMETATVAGAKLYAVYSGGAADFTAGSVVITVTYERVA